MNLNVIKCNQFMQCLAISSSQTVGREQRLTLRKVNLTAVLIMKHYADGEKHYGSDKQILGNTKFILTLSSFVLYNNLSEDVSTINSLQPSP